MAIIIGKDLCNRPLLLWRMRLINPGATTEEKLRKFLFYILEESIRMMEPNVTKYTIISDFENAGLRNFNISQLKELSPIIQDCYAERMSKLICVNTNWVMKIIWAIVKPFLDECTVRKVSKIVIIV